MCLHPIFTGMADSNKAREGTKEVRIYGVSVGTADALLNLSNNLGITVTQLMKPKLREVLDSYPDHLKQPINSLG